MTHPTIIYALLMRVTQRRGLHNEYFALISGNYFMISDQTKNKTLSRDM